MGGDSHTMVTDKIALIFPGQGSQYPGMGKSLYENFSEAKEIFDQANEILGYDIKNKIFNSSEDELKQTVVTQPAIFIMSCAAFKSFSAKSPTIAADQCLFVAGHSLGEYSALFSAEVFDFQTGLKLVEYRAKYIQECCEKNPGTMAAIIGIEKGELQKLCEQSSKEKGCCEMVNFNSPSQIVVAGAKTAIEDLMKRLSSIAGSKAIPLNVSGAFHSTLMHEASIKMFGILQSATFKNAKIPVLANCDARISTEANDIKTKLARQIDHPVLWEDSIKRMISDGIETFIEIGPGKVLAGILRKIDKKKKVLNVEDSESLQRVLNELALLG